MCVVMSKSGIEFLIDDSDKFAVEQHIWWIGQDKYPVTRIDGKPVRLHRFLMGSINDSRLVVDHINRNRLDNRRCNLRLVTRRMNNLNVGLSSANKSGVKGVYYDKINHKWRSQISINGKTIQLGRFTTFESAVEARRIAERRFYDSSESV